MCETLHSREMHFLELVAPQAAESEERLLNSSFIRAHSHHHRSSSSNKEPEHSPELTFVYVCVRVCVCGDVNKVLKG